SVVLPNERYSPHANADPKGPRRAEAGSPGAPSSRGEGFVMTSFRLGRPSWLSRSLCIVASAAAIASAFVAAAPSALADAGDVPIVGTTTGNLVVNTNAPPGCTGAAGANPCSVTVYVRGEWH